MFLQIYYQYLVLITILIKTFPLLFAVLCIRQSAPICNIETSKLKEPKIKHSHGKRQEKMQQFNNKININGLPAKHNKFTKKRSSGSIYTFYVHNEKTATGIHLCCIFSSFLYPRLQQPHMFVVVSVFGFSIGSAFPPPKRAKWAGPLQPTTYRNHISKRFSSDA